jgi:hypothetical protein
VTVIQERLLYCTIFVLPCALIEVVLNGNNDSAFQLDNGDELTKGLIIKVLVKVEVISVNLSSQVCQ